MLIIEEFGVHYNLKINNDKLTTVEFASKLEKQSKKRKFG